MLPSNPAHNSRISVAGWPFHGVIKNGQLTTSAGYVFAHPQPADGLVNIQRNPLAAAVSRTLEQQQFDDARGYEWLDHIIISGRDRYIGGVELGSNRWIYADDAGRGWVLRFEVEQNAPNVTVSVYLDSAFMLEWRADRRAGLSNIGRLLASQTYAVGTGGLEMQYTVDEVLTKQGGLEHTETGRNALINIYQFNPALTGGYFMFQGTYTELGAVIGVDVSGAGSMITDEATDYGDGIAASLSVVADHTVVFDDSFDVETRVGNVPVGQENLDLTDRVNGTWAGDIDERPCDGATQIDKYGDGSVLCWSCWQILQEHWFFDWDLYDNQNGAYTRQQGEKTIVRYVFDAADLPFAIEWILGSFRATTRTGSSDGYVESWGRYYYDANCDFINSDSLTTWHIDCSARTDRDHFESTGWKVVTPGGELYVGVTTRVISHKTELNNRPWAYPPTGYVELTSEVIDEQTNDNGTAPGKVGGGIELVDGHTVNAQSTINGSGYATNVIHISGATYQAAASENVSYNPERAEWAADAAALVAWG